MRISDWSSDVCSSDLAIDRAEKMADTAVQKVWIGCSGAGLASRIDQFDAEIGGRRIEQADIDHLLGSARDVIRPDCRLGPHAHPAQYRLGGGHGVSNPRGSHPERMGVDFHGMRADDAPLSHLTAPDRTGAESGTSWTRRVDL